MGFDLFEQDMCESFVVRCGVLFGFLVSFSFIFFHLGGGVVPGSPNPDLIADQKIVIFHTRFQTRSLKSIPIFGPGLI